MLKSAGRFRVSAVLSLPQPVNGYVWVWSLAAQVKLPPTFWTRVP